MKNSKYRTVAHLALLFFISLASNAQFETISLGRHDIAHNVLHYDSTQSRFSTVTNLGVVFPNPIWEPISWRRLAFSADLQSWDTAALHTPQVGQHFYVQITAVEGRSGKVFALRSDTTKSSWPVLPLKHLGNCDLCDLVADSLYNCRPLLPDSAYDPTYLGQYQNPDSDTLYSIMNWVTGRWDTSRQAYLVKYNWNDHSLVYDSISLTWKQYGIYPKSNFIQLPNGDWLARATLTTNNSWGDGLVRIDKNWQQVISARKSWTYELATYSRFWHWNSKIVYYSSGLDAWDPNFDPNNDFNERLSLGVYDPQSDSVTERYFLDLPASITADGQHFEPQSYGLFNGRYFVLAGLRSVDHFLPSTTGLVITVVDTNFQLVGSTVIEDTINNPPTDLWGHIRKIAENPINRDEFFYVGTLINTVLNGAYEFDLVIGKVDVNEMGLEEGIKIRKQQIWLYPNPSSGSFTLLSEVERFQPYDIKILDATGKAVFKTRIAQAEAKVHTDLPPGRYLVLDGDREVLPLLIE